jgi:uncharacterized protein (DUF111 family)
MHHDPEHDHHRAQDRPHGGSREHSHGHDAAPHKHGSRHGKGMVRSRGSILVLRPTTGIAGDMMVTGLARMLDADRQTMDALINALGLPELSGALRVEEHSLNGICGWISRVTLPHEHAHRTLADILAVVEKSALSPEAKALASSAFTILAEAEGAVHGKTPAEVSFHETGALDSILDCCLAAALFAELAPDRFVCGSLPLCDGVIQCAHGTLPCPAPAVLRLLSDVPVHGIPVCEETVTPTGLALLKAFGAEFGPWPPMVLTKTALVYGTKVFPDVPNGAIFAFGTPAYP